MGATRRMLLVGATAVTAVLSVGACASSNKATPSDAEACELDLKTLETAEEAYYAANNTYATYPQLISSQFASDPGTRTLHTVTLSSDGTSYTLTGTGKNHCTVNYPWSHA